jgi:FtsZ-interacting cell division protein ZipA
LAKYDLKSMDSDDKLTSIVQVIALAVVGLYIFWIFAVPPIMAWLSANAFTLMLIGAVCLAGVVGVGYWWVREDARATERLAREEEERVRREQEYAERLAREEEERKQRDREFADLQRQRGLELYRTTEGKAVWVPQEQLDEVARKDREEAEARKIVNRLTGHIKAFRPLRDYANEWDYHRELQIHIKAVFSDARIEVQTGSSRPDIVVQNVAIEVKGPTYSKDLQTIADKLMRYSQHYDTVIVVLFNVQVNERRYSEWERGIRNTFGDVRIICL